MFVDVLSNLLVYQKAYPDLAAEIKQVQKLPPDGSSVPTLLNAMTERLPHFEALVRSTLLLQVATQTKLVQLVNNVASENATNLQDQEAIFTLCTKAHERWPEHETIATNVNAVGLQVSEGRASSSIDAVQVAISSCIGAEGAITFTTASLNELVQATTALDSVMITDPEHKLALIGHAEKLLEHMSHVFPNYQGVLEHSVLPSLIACFMGAGGASYPHTKKLRCVAAAREVWKASEELVAIGATIDDKIAHPAHQDILMAAVRASMSMSADLAKNGVQLGDLGDTVQEVVTQADNASRDFSTALISKSSVRLQAVVKEITEYMGYNAEGGGFWSDDVQDEDDFDAWLQQGQNTILKKDASHMKSLADQVENDMNEDLQLTSKLNVQIEKDLHDTARLVLTGLRANFAEALLLRLFSTAGDDKSKKAKVHAIKRGIKKTAAWDMVGAPLRKAAAAIMRKVV